MFRVVIADDHRLLLEGLVSALEALPDVTVVATAHDGEALVAAVDEHEVDVALVDLEMPSMGGLSALGAIAESTPCIVVTMHTDDEQRTRARAAGARGFLSKATPLPDLAAAIRAVADGRELWDASLAEIVDDYRAPVLDSGAAALTEREKELLALLASGVSATDELADRLFISQKTVKNHLASVYDKLAISDRAQAAVEAIRLGLHRREM
jgi:DNA-binding NarL/FixJ family response regulator